MKIKFFPIIIFLIIYIFLFVTIPQNYKLLLIYMTPFILYTLFAFRSMLIYTKGKNTWT